MDSDPQNMTRQLRQADLLRAPAIRGAIEALRLPPGSRGLDAGCGIGSHTILLAEAVGPDGEVVGVDSSAERIAVAERPSGEATGRISYRRADVARLPFEANSFDWAWSVDCIGFIPGDRVAQIGELARVVRPGGTIALLLWSSQQLLPGYPHLEARLSGTSLGTAPFRDGDDPDSHYLRTLRAIADAGLQSGGARTFAASFHAPLGAEERDAIASMITMRWGDDPAEMHDDDRETYRRIIDRDSPDSIVHRPDYYGFLTYSMFSGNVVERRR